MTFCRFFPLPRSLLKEISARHHARTDEHVAASRFYYGPGSHNCDSPTRRIHPCHVGCTRLSLSEQGRSNFVHYQQVGCCWFSCRLHTACQILPA